MSDSEGEEDLWWPDPEVERKLDVDGLFGQVLTELGLPHSVSGLIGRRFVFWSVRRKGGAEDKTTIACCGTLTGAEIVRHAHPTLGDTTFLHLYTSGVRYDGDAIKHFLVQSVAEEGVWIADVVCSYGFDSEDEEITGDSGGLMKLL